MTTVRILFKRTKVLSLATINRIAELLTPIAVFILPTQGGGVRMDVDTDLDLAQNQAANLLFGIGEVSEITCVKG